MRGGPGHGAKRKLGRRAARPRGDTGDSYWGRHERRPWALHRAETGLAGIANLGAAQGGK
eukprot:2909753-Alexandrium_andersonii.AAC.1